MNAIEMASTIPPAKTCGCGRQYSDESFDALHFAGLQFVPGDETEPAEAIPMRDCGCKSTIAREAVVGEVAILDWMIAHWNLILAHDRERRGIFPDDVELEEVSGAYSAREVWDEFTDRQDFAEEEP